MTHEPKSGICRVMICGFVGDVLHRIGYVYLTEDEPVLAVRCYPDFTMVQEDDRRED